MNTADVGRHIPGTERILPKQIAPCKGKASPGSEIVQIASFAVGV
jgi:hypothetical protein